MSVFVNAVPVVGVLRYGWSAINVLALYWFEILLIVVCTAIRSAVQRKRLPGSHAAGSESADRMLGAHPFGGCFNAAFAFFVVIEGIFLVMLAVMLAHRRPDNAMWLFSLPQAARGALMLCIMFGIDLLAGLRTIGMHVDAWDRLEADNRIRRLGVLHVSLWFGLVAMKLTGWPYAALVALVVLKTFADVSSALGLRGWSRRRAEPQ